MAGLVPAIHAFLNAAKKTWMPATSAGMTKHSLVAAGAGRRSNLGTNGLSRRYLWFQCEEIQPKKF